MAPLSEIERLPDELLLNILNHVSDIKTVVRCYAVSRRFHMVVPFVSSLFIPVESIIFSFPGFSDFFYPFSPALLGSSPVSTDNNSPTDLYFVGFRFAASIIGSLVSRLRLHLKVKPPLQSLGFNSSFPNPHSLYAASAHHTLVRHVLENFSDLRTLGFHLPSGELPLNDSSSSPLLRWRARFGSSFNRCLILAAAATSSSSPRTGSESAALAIAVADDDTIPDSTYTELGVALTRFSLFVASERFRLLRRIISEHTTLETLALRDADGQGVLRMDRDQLEELRKKPMSALLKSRMMIPAFRMRQWYTPVVKLSCGAVLKGATLVAVLSSSGGEKKDMELGWIEEEFDGDGEGMYAEAVRMLVKEERTHYLEMNSPS